MVNPPPINLGGQQGARSLYQFTLQDTDTDELYRWAPMLEEKMRELPGLEDVSSDLQIKNPQIQRRHRPRQDLRARPDRQPGRDGAVQRLRHAPGLADLRAEQPVPGDPAGRAGVPAAIRRRCRMLYVRSSSGQLIPLEHRRDASTTDAGPLDRQPHRPAAVGDDLVQPEARRRARRRGRRDSSDGRGSTLPSTIVDDASRARRRRSRIRCRASA